MSTLMRSQLFLPFYAGLLVLVLIAVIFLVDKDTPNLVFVLLLGLYLGLLFYYWRQYKSKPKGPRIPSLDDYKQSNKRPAVLANFEGLAESMLRQINMKNNQRSNELQYLSTYSNSYNNPSSLKQIQLPTNDYTEESSIFGTYNIQIWRDQFRQALEQFKNNMKTDIKNNQVYMTVLNKLNLDTNNLQQSQQIVQSFLNDRCTQYCIRTIKVVNQVNKILSRNFALSLTTTSTTNPKEIEMVQFDRLLAYYQQNKTLPSAYRNLVNSSPNEAFAGSGLILGKNTGNRLDNDMNELMKYLIDLRPMTSFPNQIFNSYALMYILNQQFVNQKVQQVTSYNSRMKSPSKDTPNQFMRANQKYTSYLLIQDDYWMSLTSAPQFRTKNCKKLCLVYLLLLIKRDNNNGHPLIRSLKRMMR